MPIPLRRIALTLLSARRRPPTGRLRHRVWPSYVDLNLHMNHASYLEVMELARWHWCAERDVLSTWFRQRVTPIVVHEEINFKRELKPLQRFDVVTRLVERAGKTATFSHQFVVGERVHAEGRCRFLMRSGGKVLDAPATAALLDPLVEA